MAGASKLANARSIDDRGYKSKIFAVDIGLSWADQEVEVMGKLTVTPRHGLAL